MINRRKALLQLGAVSAAPFLSKGLFASTSETQSNHQFRYCLNTSTIAGQKFALRQVIETASEAGYDGIKLWVREVKAYRDTGNSLKELKSYIDDLGLQVENAIGFAPWIVNDDEVRAAGMKQMEEEMLMMAELGCKRIAAPPIGAHGEGTIDLQVAGQRFRELIELGEKTGVMPMLEIWGASKNLYDLGQALQVAAAANHPDVKLLLDVYHLFRGGSGFDSLKLLNGNCIEVFHMNDYPGSIPREKQDDSDRVFPGDGVAPIVQVLKDLHSAGGSKVLSRELFNADYYKRDALDVAKTGLQKMKALVNEAIT